MPIQPENWLVRRPIIPSWAANAAVMTVLGCCVTARAQVAAPGAAASAADITLPPIVVEGARLRLVAPLPGVRFDRSEMTTNVQGGTAEDIRRSQSASMTDVLNNRLQSVSVNDYQGNPFQQDLVFRGFSASPAIGTPQGLSVYIDGIRVNEPFGEVVNWDLIPLNAIESFDLIPGASPLFGLNTLGGALAIATKTGFSSPRYDATATGGSWGRRQLQLSAGGNNGTLAGFIAGTAFNEHGWRDDSPSQVRQLFGRIDARTGAWTAGISGLRADNHLTGNGMIPIELYRERPESVFTSPDDTQNTVTQLAVNAGYKLSQAINLSAQAYRRRLDQTSNSGDLWDEFRTASARLQLPCPNGVGTSDGAIGVDLPGCPGVLPNGLFNIGRSGQKAYGTALQMTFTSEQHQAVVGATHDHNSITFSQSQRLGFIQADHAVALAPELYDELGLTALRDEVQRNNLSGGSRTTSVFFQDVWSPRDNLHVNAGLRWNLTRVSTNLVSDRPIPLYSFDANLARRQLPRCGAESGDRFARYYCTNGEYSYRSLNPAFGVAWLPSPGWNLYGNASKGTRAPSAIELGCARDREGERLAGGGGTNTGRTPGCSIPTGLTYDPYLPQVTAYNYEVGVRGSVSPKLNWNASAYRSTLHDDILFVSLGSRNRGVFDTFGRTRREGFELGADGTFGAHQLRASMSYVKATFESTAEVVNVSNSASVRESGKVSTFTIYPADRIPGIPSTTVRLAWTWTALPAWEIGLTMAAQSAQYVRGNENNEHQPGGTDSNGDPTLGTLDPTITVEPGRAFVSEGRLPGFAVFNATTRWQITPRLALIGRVDNIFDRRYATAGELALNPFTPSRWGARDAGGFNYNSNDWQNTTFVGPGSVRGFWIGLNYAFDSGGKPS